MEGPHPGGTALLITVTPTPGKYALLVAAPSIHNLRVREDSQEEHCGGIYRVRTELTPQHYKALEKCGSTSKVTTR
jgi:hypothetical protein